MAPWTHLIRFEAVEDGRVHLGQLADSSLDIGLAMLEGKAVQAYRVYGDIYHATVTNQLFTVHKVRLAPSTEIICVDKTAL